MILASLVAGAVPGIANGDYLVDGAVQRPTGEPPSRNRGVGSLDLETPFGLPLSPPVVPPGA